MLYGSRARLTTYPVKSLLIFLLVLTLDASADSPSRYDTKIPYRENQAVVFPDFTLTYTGSREVKGPGKLSWKAHEFTVSTGGKEQKVSWSSGTGDIGPTQFTAAGKIFFLELSISDTLGRLKPGELVIRPKNR